MFFVTCQSKCYSQKLQDAGEYAPLVKHMRSKLHGVPLPGGPSLSNSEVHDVFARIEGHLYQQEHMRLGSGVR